MKLSYRLLKRAQKALVDLLIKHDEVSGVGWDVVNDIDKFFIGVE